MRPSHRQLGVPSPRSQGSVVSGRSMAHTSKLGMTVRRLDGVRTIVHACVGGHHSLRVASCCHVVSSLCTSGPPGFLRMISPPPHPLCASTEANPNIVSRATLSIVVVSVSVNIDTVENETRMRQENVSKNEKSFYKSAC